MIRRAFDWTFRSRETGRIVIAQAPNIPLAIFLVAAVARRLLHPHGTVGTVLSVIAAGAIVVWAVDEIARGVNPWRRALGLVVLSVAIYGIATR